MAVSATSVSIGTSLNLPAIASPSAPANGTTLYAKSDGKLYATPSGGVETSLATALDGDLRVRSTGARSYTGMTIASSTTVTIPAVKGQIVTNTGASADTPTTVQIIYAGATVTPDYLLTADATYMLINSSGALVQQSTLPTPAQRRANIWIGKVAHPSRATILAVDNITDYDASPMSALRNMFAPFRFINGGIAVSYNGANLSLNRSTGTLSGPGINFATDPTSPDTITIASASPLSFYYRTQLGGATGLVTVLDPTSYDVGGTVTAISTSGDGQGNRSTNVRVFQYPTGVVNIQYGQTVYSSLANAVAAIPTETFIKSPNNASTAQLIGVISVRRVATVLNDTTYAVFTPASMLGEIIGGTMGLATTTLQQAYDNSQTPEIVTDSTRGAVTVKEGTNVSTASALEVQNYAGTVTAYAMGNGTWVGRNSEVLVTSYSTNQVLTAADSVVLYTGSGLATFTLPAANVLGAGITKTIRIKVTGAGSVLFTRAGSDTIERVYTTTPKALLQDESWTLISDGTSNWMIF